MNTTRKLIDKVYKTIARYNMIERGDRVLVGLSGGADSMCMLHALKTLSGMLGFEVAAAHMNHNIRGDEALSDAEKARDAARELETPFFLRSENVPKYAENNSMSEELAGRELRYAFFEEISKKHGYNKIATAHNKNDNAETILMNFLRGSGLSGLGGIPAVRGNIIRPLIDIEREEIEKYCAENGLEYVTDSTNLKAVYTRNKIRLELIPNIKLNFNPNFTETVTSNAAVISGENDYLNEEAEKAYKYVLTRGNGRIDADKLNSLHPAMKRRVIVKFLQKIYGSLSDITLKATEDILSLCEKNETGKRVCIPKGIEAVLEYGELFAEKPRPRDQYLYKLKIGEDLFIREAGIVIRADICEERISDGAVYISCDDISRLYVRNRQNGDYFFPSGMTGKKKIKDFFADKKIPAEERMRIPLIMVGDDIAAAADMRVDRRFMFAENKINLRITFVRCQ